MCGSRKDSDAYDVCGRSVLYDLLCAPCPVLSPPHISLPPALFAMSSDYLPPEMLSQQPHSNMTDSWTCGVLCYELIYGKAPFTGANHQETYKNIAKGAYRRHACFSNGNSTPTSTRTICVYYICTLAPHLIARPVLQNACSSSRCPCVSTPRRDTRAESSSCTPGLRSESLTYHALMCEP